MTVQSDLLREYAGSRTFLHLTARPLHVRLTNLPAVSKHSSSTLRFLVRKKKRQWELPTYRRQQRARLEVKVQAPHRKTKRQATRMCKLTIVHSPTCHHAWLEIVKSCRRGCSPNETNNLLTCPLLRGGRKIHTHMNNWPKPVIGDKHDCPRCDYDTYDMRDFRIVRGLKYGLGSGIYGPDFKEPRSGFEWKQGTGWKAPDSKRPVHKALGHGAGHSWSIMLCSVM